MPFVSVTRLRLRSVRFLPGFVRHTLPSLAQVKRSPGFLGGSLLPDRRLTFWTLTVWNTAEAMRGYRNHGAHLQAMKYLLDWCDEASYVHWEQPSAGETAPVVPAWDVADQRMRSEGRVSKVRHPSPAHADLTYRAPRLTAAGPLRPSPSRANP